MCRTGFIFSVFVLIFAFSSIVVSASTIEASELTIEATTSTDTNSGTPSGTNSDANSGANSGANSDANSGANSGANSDVNSGANSGTNSDANSDVNSDGDTLMLDDKALEDRVTTLEKQIVKLEAIVDNNKKRVNVSSKKYSPWRLSLGGRFFYDGMSPGGISSDLEASVGAISSSTELRKARLGVNGHSKMKVNFKLEFEFAGGDVDYTDIYVSMPVKGRTKTHIGRQKEPFGMEQANSSNYLPFMERSLVSRSFMPSRSTGVTLLTRKKPGTGIGWQLGYFRNTNSYAIEDDKSGQNLTGRFIYDHICENHGENLLHFGASYSHHHPDDEFLSISGKTGSHLLPDFGDTGQMNVEHTDILGGEIAFQRKSFSFQTEFAKNIVHLKNGLTADFSGYYVFAGWFLTGEYRRYSHRYGAMTSVKPVRDFENYNGGALQFVSRYHTLDLNDSGASINGGKISEFDLGFNWYLHSNSRIMLNWLRPSLKGVDRAEIIQMRFQVDF